MNGSSLSNTDVVDFDLYPAKSELHLYFFYLKILICYISTQTTQYGAHLKLLSFVASIEFPQH